MKYLSSILSSSLGNILEWYDFGLFTIFSPLFSRIFFPNSEPNTALIATFSIFAVGFICRPIGSLLFGYFGDTIGRAKTLRFSILMISLPTLLIGCLPTFLQIGIAAPILLTLIRIWQGISLGGEYSGNIIYLAEIAPSKHRAFFTSLGSTGANIGVLLAAVVSLISSTLFPEHILNSWAWRIPYLVSGLLCIFIYIFRLQLKETKVFDYLKHEKKLADNPIKTAFTINRFAMLRTLGMVCMGSTFYYFCFIYLPIFLAKYHPTSIHRISAFIFLLIGLMIVLAPLFGGLCDKVGRRKLLLFNAAAIIVFIVPGFYLLKFNFSYLSILVFLLFTLFSSLEQGTTSVAIVENFPPTARYTGLSFAYNIGNGLLGGTVPIVSEWLMTGHFFNLAPAFYIMSFAVITFCVVYFFVPETLGKSLR
jgi:MFS transporter, MHS family, proline/betaine transporter